MPCSNSSFDGIARQPIRRADASAECRCIGRGRSDCRFAHPNRPQMTQGGWMRNCLQTAEWREHVQ
jgi:hypothetical protein